MTQVKEQLPRTTKKILVGHSVDENTIYVLEVDTTDGYFSITYDGYDDGFLDNESGERTAREYLEDGELWRSHVAAESTESGLDDWIEEVLNMDGWTEVIGDVRYIGQKNDKEYYAQLTSCGAGEGNNYLGIDQLKITKAELKKIAKAVDELHLKRFDGSGSDKPEDGVMFQNMNAKEIAQAKEVIAIFNKYPAFELEQLFQYVKEDA